MKHIVMGCALALSLGSAAMASDQLARQLGVQPGVYTLAELVEIKAAQEQNDSLRLKWAMQRTDVVVSTQSIGGGARMNQQLAWNIGVDPADFTTAELSKMFLALDD